MIALEIFSLKPRHFPTKEDRQYERELEESNIDDLRKRAKTALAKAMKERPKVKRLLWLDQPPLYRRYYSVKARKRDASEYSVTLETDRDGQWFGDCTCPAGSPPAQEFTGVIQWHPVPCYHLAAVLLQYARDYSKKPVEPPKQKVVKRPRKVLPFPKKVNVARQQRPRRL